MTAAPKGYVALTSSRDGSTFLLDARGLTVMPSSGATTGANKLPTNCLVGPVTDTDSYWFVAETFDEVCAKLAAALGEQGAGDDAWAWKSLAAHWRDLGRYGFADGHGHPLTNCAPFIAIGRLAESRGVAPKPAAPARAVAPEEMVHHAEQLETARRALLSVPFAEPVRQAICAMDNAQAALRRVAQGGAL